MLTRRAILGMFPALIVAPAAFSAPRRSSAKVTRDALSQINAFRKANRRDALIVDPVLELAALDHAVNLAYLGELNHKGFRARLRKYGIWKPAAENVAMGQRNIASVLRAWENSSSHRRNILGSYNRVGLAVARNENSGGRPYWVMILSD